MQPLYDYNHFHLVGAGGAGLSALARVLVGYGKVVSGYDAMHTGVTEALSRLGVILHCGPADSALPTGVQVVVRSLAIVDSDPQLVQARERQLPILSYPQAVGELMRHRYGLAVAGTHGKTTTSAMLGKVLLEAGADPTTIVGGESGECGSGTRAGSGAYFVAEACEFGRSFLHLHPRIAIITNVEGDHLDYYRDLEEIRGAFLAFASRVPAHGFVVACVDGQATVDGLGDLSGRLVTYGFSEAAEVRATLLQARAGCVRFSVDSLEHGHWGRFALAVPGAHNVLNALAVITTARLLKLPLGSVRSSLATFAGVRRRFERVCEVGGIAIVDDYAHHPTEIRATLTAAREAYPEGRVTAVFQPHQHSRTRHLFDGFVDALAGADRVLLDTIYAARDDQSARDSVSSTALAEALREAGVDASYHAERDDLARAALAQACPGDVILTLGAGDVDAVARRMQALKQTHTHRHPHSRWERTPRVGS